MRGREVSPGTDGSGLAVAAAGGGLGAAISALLAGACCVGPISVSLLGVGGAMAAAGLAPYRSWLLGVSVALLAGPFWFVYRPLGVTGATCRPGAGRWSRRLVWFAAVAVGVSFALPHWVG